MESTSFFQKIKKHGSSIAFLLGFIWDNFMLTHVDYMIVNISLAIYLVISAVCILVMNMPPSATLRGRLVEKVSRFLPIILQFCFGSLCSAYIIFYTRSSSLSTDWPFLLFLLILVVSNELFRKKYTATTIPISVYFIVFFSYSIFSLPTFLSSFKTNIFIFAGILSLIVIYILVFLIKKISPERYFGSKKTIMLSVSAIYVFFNVAYFANLIPPVPLALKGIGVYHSVIRDKIGNYYLTYEAGSKLPFFSRTSKIFHDDRNGSVYVWSSIFAPQKLTTPVFHRWEYFDENDKKWITTDLIRFTVYGGRENGYRGYTTKSSIFKASWRVTVETERSNVIGRINFSVEKNKGQSLNLVTDVQ